jgi:hypothetical protein
MLLGFTKLRYCHYASNATRFFYNTEVRPQLSRDLILEKDLIPETHILCKKGCPYVTV